MTIERTINGYWRITTMHNDRYVTQLYIGYTKREAIKEFKLYLKEL